MRVAGLLGCLVAGLLAGCGYALVGKSNNLLPPTVHTLSVPAFVNKTTRVELEQRVPQAVADEFVSRGRLRLVRSEKDADVILHLHEYDREFLK